MSAEHQHPCECGHDVYWHHETRGCGYHGHGPNACPCRLRHSEALTLYVAATRADERALVLGEVERRIPVHGTGQDALAVVRGEIARHRFLSESVVRSKGVER